MCSICGIVDYKNKEKASAELACRMGRTMAHRGPDQTDQCHMEYAAFHHNRLAVIDPEHGLQPMTVQHNGHTYTIVYNGELYNTPELTKELQYGGVQLQTACDTEVVLYAYILFGEDCPKLLNGIFAFCIYDENRRQVFLARDRFGVKPLFYTLDDTSLLFASEVKALLAHPHVKHEVDAEGLWQLLFLSPVTVNGSGVFKNIKEVLPAHCGTFSAEGLKLRAYWQLEAQELQVTAEEAAAQTGELLRDAIRRQMVSDVPLCTFLSGGLDSSVITAVAAEYYKERGWELATYSFEYEGNKQNFHSSLFQPQGDDEFAVYLADYLGTKHTVLTAPTDCVAGYLPDAAYFRDFPGQADIDSSLLYFCRKVKQAHTVAVSGECSDEIFGGYPWFYRPEMLYKDFFPWIHNPFVRAELFDDSFAKRKQGYDYCSGIYRGSIAECAVLDTDSDTMKTSRIATWLSVHYFMTSLLERKDRMSMARGLEVRVPFADHRLLEYVYNVPWEIKFENNVEKALLRNAMAAYLPDKILNRKKSPYPKTHNPKYEALTLGMLRERMQKAGVLKEYLCKERLDELLEKEPSTWFGQLMSRPQLLAWLVQFDCWAERYRVNFV